MNDLTYLNTQYNGNGGVTQDYTSKFPNEVNFRKKTLNELNEKIKKIRSKIKPLSLNKLKNKRNNIQDEEKFTLITTINVPKEKIEEK